VRCVWSDNYLYVGYQCPFTEITVFTPPDSKKERFGLWERDVVEAFVGTDPDNAKHYYEFEASPRGERLDLELGGASKNLDWNSGFESVARVNKQTRLWTVELRLPLAALAQGKPVRGTRWRLNLYRHDLAHQAFLAWSPTATSTAHTPGKFGYLDFEE